MDSKKLKQVVNQLKKQFKDFEVEKLIAHSNDESQTRDNLIHPFLNILNYQKIEDYTHEFVADLKDKRGKKVDIAITIGKKNPVILIECKRANQKLNDNHFRQLRDYCTDTPSAKIGILTNRLNIFIFRIDFIRFQMKLSILVRFVIFREISRKAIKYADLL